MTLTLNPNCNQVDVGMEQMHEIVSGARDYVDTALNIPLPKYSAGDADEVGSSLAELRQFVESAVKSTEVQVELLRQYVDDTMEGDRSRSLCDKEEFSFNGGDDPYRSASSGPLRGRSHPAFQSPPRSLSRPRSQPRGMGSGTHGRGNVRLAWGLWREFGGSRRQWTRGACIFRGNALLKGWMAWLHLKVEATEARRIVGVAVRQMLHRARSEGWRLWRGALSKHSRHQELLVRGAGQLRSVRVAAGMRQWRVTVLGMLHDRASLIAACKRMLQRRSAQAWGQWRMQGDEMRQRMMVLQGVMYMMLRVLARSFGTWRGNTAQLLREEDVLAGSLARLASRQLSRAWITWAEQALAMKSHRAVMSRALLMNQVISTSVAYGRWLMAAVELGRRRRMLQGTLTHGVSIVAVSVAVAVPRRCLFGELFRCCYKLLP